MQQGEVVRIMDKGFGFIKMEGAEKDLFFHANSLANIGFDELQEGDKVEFEIEEGDKGQSAINVNRV